MNLDRSENGIAMIIPLKYSYAIKSRQRQQL